MDALKVTIEFFLNTEINRIFLAFGMLLILLSIIDIHKWVKMNKFSRFLAFMLGSFFLIGTIMGITDSQTKVLTKKKKEIQQKEKAEEESEREKINSLIEDNAIKEKKIEELKDKVSELERSNQSLNQQIKKLIRKDKVNSQLKKPKKTISSNAKSFIEIKNNTLFKHESCQLKFTEKNENQYNFSGFLFSCPVSGKLKIIGNKITITESDNCSGNMFLSESSSYLHLEFHRSTLKVVQTSDCYRLPNSRVSLSAKK